MDLKVLETVLGSRIGEKAAVVTIIATRGSTPRKPGAQIMFFPDGRTSGTIGGGCAEAEVRRHALDVIETGERSLVEINLNREVAEQTGMVCGGTMEVLIERVDF